MLGVLFLNFISTTSVVMPDQGQPSAEEFVNELNSAPSVVADAAHIAVDCMPDESRLNKILTTVVEHMPEAVMIGILVAYCRYDGIRNWTVEKYNAFVAYIKSRFNKRTMHEQK